MKKIKSMLKKGGVADIVTLMIIVGLVIALIIAVVLPIVNKSKTTANQDLTDMQNVDSEITSLKDPITGTTGG